MLFISYASTYVCTYQCADLTQGLIYVPTAFSQNLLHILGEWCPVTHSFTSQHGEPNPTIDIWTRMKGIKHSDQIIQ